MPYSFEEYDAFLASFDNNNNNNNNNNMVNTGAANAINKEELLDNPQVQVMSNPSWSTGVSTDDDDLLGMNTFYDFNGDSQRTNANNFVISPYYASNSSNSPAENLPVFGTESLNSSNEFNFDGLDQTLQQNIQSGQIQQSNFQLTNSNANNINNNNNIVKREPTSIGYSDSQSLHIKHSDSESNISSELNSPEGIQQQKKKSLKKAVPHQGSISKKGVKKEKTSHNAIERRYRTNINDKIKALRDSVPALRVLVDSGDEDLDDQLDGLQPAKKLNKATILSKATEFIKHLEAKNELLRKENDELKFKLAEVGISHSSFGSPNGTPDSLDGTRIFEDQQQQSPKSSLTNKLLLGGLGCMVGSGLREDFQNSDFKGLFALPVLGYDNISGFQSFDKSLMALLKISLIVGLVMNFILPSFFAKKEKKHETEVTSFDDVKNLKKTSIWKSFFFSTSNNDYVKNSIFRALWLKVNYHNSNVLTKSVVQVYVDHLWNYLQKVKLNPENNDYDNLKLILSLPISKSINNEEYILNFLKYEKLLNRSSDYDTSSISLFYRMINETTTNSALRKLLESSVLEPTKAISDISNELSEEVDGKNLELQTLLQPTDQKIDVFQKTLETYDVSKVSTDDLLVLYSSIIQNSIHKKKDFNKAKHWFDKLNMNEFKEFSLLGFTSLYLIVNSMTSNEDLYKDDKETIHKIEELTGSLRIWAGSSNGSILNFKKRSLLIDYFVNVGLMLNGLDKNNGGVTE